MSDRSKIQWTEATWNPVTGCTPVSPGCQNCYARRMAKRLKAMGQEKYRNGFEVTLHPDTLDAPLRWRKPRKVFVCSMSDLFHEAVPIAFLAEVFDTMACATVTCGKRHQHEPECWQGDPHQFQLLTKRSERMREVISTELSRWSAENMPGDCALSVAFEAGFWPLPNVHLGVTAENQEMLEARVPDLLATPAARRFLSLEPLLGAVDLSAHGGCHCPDAQGLLDWVVVGGESGPGARPMDEDWVRSIRDQCVAAGVPFMYKQRLDGGKKVSLPKLDGHVWAGVIDAS